VNFKKNTQLLYGLKNTLLKKYLTKITNYADEYFLITNTSFNNIQNIGMVNKLQLLQNLYVLKMEDMKQEN
jgi:hypothetical protein